MINVRVKYPENMEELENKAAEVMAEILFKKLQPKEVEEFVKLLTDDNLQIKL